MNNPAHKGSILEATSRRKTSGSPELSSVFAQSRVMLLSDNRGCCEGLGRDVEQQIHPFKVFPVLPVLRCPAERRGPVF